MSSSSDMEVTSAQSQPASAQPDRWVPQFQIRGNYVTSADSVMQNDLTALAVGRNIIMPEDAPILTSASDTALANGCLILNIRATTALSNVCTRLWERNVEIVTQSRQRDVLRQKVTALKDENRELKKQLKKVRKMKEALACRLIFYQDFINTKVLEFDEEMEEVQKRVNLVQGMFHQCHQNSHISIPKGHKRSKSS